MRLGTRNGDKPETLAPDFYRRTLGWLPSVVLGWAMLLSAASAAAAEENKPLFGVSSSWEIGTILLLLALAVVGGAVWGKYLAVRRHESAEDAADGSYIGEHGFQKLFEDNPDPEWLTEGGQIIKINRAACRELGYVAPEEVVGKTLAELSSPMQDDGRPMAAALAEIAGRLAERKTLRYEWQYCRRDGQNIPAEGTLTALTLNGKKLVWSVWWNRSSRKQLEQMLQNNELIHRVITENVEDLIWIFEVKTERLSYISPSVFRVGGFTPEEVTKMSVAQLLTPESYQQLRQFLADRMTAFAAGDDNVRVMTHRLYHVHKNGSVIPCEVVSTLLADAERNVYELVGVTRDISSRVRQENLQREIEQRLLQSQKLESLGMLAGGIAHDFNNLLTSIMGNLDLVKKRLGADSRELHYLDQSLAATRRAADLTRQMLAYSGCGKVMEQTVDLSDFVSRNLSLFQTSIPSRIMFRQQLTWPLPSIAVDPGQLQQVFVNLLTNAAEALGEGTGEVTIVTGERNFSTAELVGSRVELPLPAGRYVFAEIRDTGCGMTPEMQTRIFEPFFSTKFTGRGMGMAAVQGIMKAHRGAILLNSREGKGTIITLVFKIIATSASTREGGTMSNEITRADGDGEERGTVLVVEDEPMVRRLCCDMIEESGYHTFNAADGQEGIDVFNAHAGEISCVLLDLSMPVKDGLVVFDAIRQDHPEAKVILSSGYSQEEATKKFAGKGLSGFIQKPYVMDELVGLLQKVMTATPGSGMATR